MKINTTKFKAFFGLSPEATAAELDRKVDEELEAREAAAAKEQGEDAGEEDTTETDTSTDATEQEQANDEDTAPAAGITMEQVTAAVKAAVDPLAARLAAIEAQDADEATGGKPEATKVTDEEDQPLWMQTPANQRAAQVFGDSKK